MTHSSFRRIPHALGVFAVMLSASLMLVALLVSLPFALGLLA